MAVDLFCGLGGWTEGMLAEGFECIGFDIECHQYGDSKYPAQLVLQDILTLRGSQFKDADLIVASPPCQRFSWMAMPWSKAKEKARWYRDHARDGDPEGPRAAERQRELTALFDACFRIQREAIEAAGHFIPLVVENVRGAQKWVGRARWNFGSFYLWGDVPALMPMTKSFKNPGVRRWNDFNDYGKVSPAWTTAGTKNNGGSWFNIAHNTTSGHGQNPDGRKGIPPRPTGHWTNPEENGTKQGGDWFNASQPSISRLTGSKSNARKAASAQIAKIPFQLSRYIATVFKPGRKVAA